MVISGFDSEVGFWRKEVEKTKNYDYFPHKLLDFIEPPADVLEVGSGPCSTLAWGVDEGLLDVVALDPLANVYHHLTDTWPVIPTFGCGEIAHLAFPANHFDIAYARNALDHCIDPERVLESMTEAVKLGGYVYIESKNNEGLGNAYRGLHQHDLTLVSLPIPDGLQLVYDDQEPVGLDDGFTAVFRRRA